jgi:GR25 family glycosyltransferase involved in LPS biosynthesis
MLLWDYIKNTRKNNEEYVLILEDDATFNKNSIENIEITLDRLSNLNWDILYIGHSHNVKGNIILSNIIDPSSNPYPEKKKKLWILGVCY